MDNAGTRATRPPTQTTTAAGNQPLTAACSHSGPARPGPGSPASGGYMQSTGKSQGDGVLAATLALAVNGLIAWQLQALLAPQPVTALDAAATAALEVTWITPVPHRDQVVAAPVEARTAMPRAAPAIDRPRQVRAIARPEPAATATPADLLPARPLSAACNRRGSGRGTTRSRPSRSIHSPTDAWHWPSRLRAASDCSRRAPWLAQSPRWGV